MTLFIGGCLPCLGVPAPCQLRECSRSLPLDLPWRGGAQQWLKRHGRMQRDPALSLLQGASSRQKLVLHMSSENHAFGIWRGPESSTGPNLYGAVIPASSSSSAICLDFQMGALKRAPSTWQGPDVLVPCGPIGISSSRTVNLGGQGLWLIQPDMLFGGKTRAQQR